MKRSEVNNGCLPQSLSTLFLSRVSHWTWHSLSQGGCMASKLQSSTCLHPQCQDCRCVLPPQFFLYSLGNGTWVLRIPRWAPYHLRCLSRPPFSCGGKRFRNTSLRLALNLLCSQGWLWTGQPPVLPSQMLGLHLYILRNTDLHF